jgi:hypothetical protein
MGILMKKWRIFSIYSLFLLILLVPLVSSCANPLNKQTQEDSQSGDLSNSIVNSSTNVGATATATYNATCNVSGPSSKSTTSVTVTIDKQCSMSSQFEPGITLSDNSLDPDSGNDTYSVNNVESMIQSGVKYMNTPIMGWGMVDPWPDPTTPGPTDWSSLDANMNMAVQLHETPVITLATAPWWMKGVYEGDGKTQLLTQSDEWNANLAYSSRILDNKMGDWTTLVRDIAQRYMAPPYNVRYFQVWNELKGYWDFDTNNWDFNNSPGPAGPKAQEGYTYMYNQVYQTLMSVAKSMNIPTQDIKVGGPYVFVDLLSNSHSGGVSNLNEPYGIVDQRTLDVFEYWLQHKDGAGFITFDASLEDHDDGTILHNQPFAAADVFADMVKWIRSLDPTLYPGSTTLPVWLAEWFSWTEQSGTSATEDNALKAYTMTQYIQAGGATALSWNNFGNGGADYGLWTPLTAYGGGEPYAWYYTYQSLMNDFGKGTTIYKTTVSNPSVVGALASAKYLMLVNETANDVTVKVNGSTISLSPYQVDITSNK